MRLTRRWTIHLLWKYRTLRDALCLWIARHLPKRLTYWCAVVVGAHATSGKHDTQIVPELRFMDAIQRWPLE